MIKKKNKVKLTTMITNTTQDELARYAKDKDLFIGDIVETALHNFFHPFDKETHEKHNKMQLSKIINMLTAANNKLDIGLICNEEYIKTFFRNIPELTLEDSQARIATSVRITEGHENFMKRVIDSAINNKPNILSAFNITKINDIP